MKTFVASLFQGQENSPLYNELLKRSDARLAKQRLAAEDEMKRQEQDALIKQQTEVDFILDCIRFSTHY